MPRGFPTPPTAGSGSPELDLSFRPATYWPGDDVRLAILGNILGEARRRAVERAMDSQELDCPPEGLLRPVLEPGLREVMGRIHPMLMGGEYLPPYLPGEVEIARVALASVTADVISVRARMATDGLIHYRVVDEYEFNVYQITPEWSATPLTAGELVGVMDTAQGCGDGIVEGVIDLNLSEGAELKHMKGFVTVRSDFYPGLGDYYRGRCESLLHAWAHKEDGDED